jgi:hypothetical protein
VSHLCGCPKVNLGLRNAVLNLGVQSSSSSELLGFARTLCSATRRGLRWCHPLLLPAACSDWTTISQASYLQHRTTGSSRPQQNPWRRPNEANVDSDPTDPGPGEWCGYGVGILGNGLLPSFPVTYYHHLTSARPPERRRSYVTWNRSSPTFSFSWDPCSHPKNTQVGSLPLFVIALWLFKKFVEKNECHVLKNNRVCT